jgi:anti-anti-sigma regulatory factor
MEITISVQQGTEPVAIMHIKGAIDASNIVGMVNKAQEIYKNPARNLIVDLSEVPYISSAGLVAIHKIALLYSGVPQEAEENSRPDLTHSQDARKRVKLLKPQQGVAETLETTGMKFFFKVFDDLESAVQSF